MKSLSFLLTLLILPAASLAAPNTVVELGGYTYKIHEGCVIAQPVTDKPAREVPCTTRIEPKSILALKDQLLLLNANGIFFLDDSDVDSINWVRVTSEDSSYPSYAFVDFFVIDSTIAALSKQNSLYFFTAADGGKLKGVKPFWSIKTSIFTRWIAIDSKDVRTEFSGSTISNIKEIVSTGDGDYSIVRSSGKTLSLKTVIADLGKAEQAMANIKEESSSNSSIE